MQIGVRVQSPWRQNVDKNGRRALRTRRFLALVLLNGALCMQETAALLFLTVKLAKKTQRARCTCFCMCIEVNVNI